MYSLQTPVFHAPGCVSQALAIFQVKGSINNGDPRQERRIWPSSLQRVSSGLHADDVPFRVQVPYITPSGTTPPATGQSVYYQPLHPEHLSYHPRHPSPRENQRPVSWPRVVSGLETRARPAQGMSPAEERRCVHHWQHPTWPHAPGIEGTESFRDGQIAESVAARRCESDAVIHRAWAFMVKQAMPPSPP